MLTTVNSDALVRYRGDTLPDVFVVKDGGVVVDLTGYSAKFSLSTTKDPDADATPVYTLDASIPTPTDGKLYFQPSPTQAAQAPGSYFYDVELTFPTGDKVTIAKGSYKFKADITP